MATGHINLHPLGGIKDVTNPPAILYQGARPYLAFDETTDEIITWSLALPDDFASGLTIKCHYSMASATTNNVAVGCEVMAVSDAETINVDSYDTQNTSSDSAVPVSVSTKKNITLALTNADSVAAGDYISLKFRRENTTTGTNATGDMYVWALALTYTTT